MISADSILRAAHAVVTVADGRGGYGCTAVVLGPHERGLRVRVTHANPGATVVPGDVLGIPVERVSIWTSER